MAERHLLDARKAELFLRATDDVLEKKLFFLEDRATKGGFINDWRRIEQTITLIAKQQKMKGRSLALQMTRSSLSVAKAPKVAPTPIASPFISKTAKPVDEGTVEELIKGFKELKVEMSELRKARASNSFQPSNSGRTYVKRCVFCDKKIKEDEGYKLCDYEALDEAISKGVAYFKDSKLHDAATDLSLPTNYSKGGIKKLLEDKFGKANAMHAKDASAYSVEVECCPIDASK